MTPIQLRLLSGLSEERLQGRALVSAHFHVLERQVRWPRVTGGPSGAPYKAVEKARN